MKICFFNCAKVWGGGEKWHLDFALAFSQEKHDVFVVSNKNSELLKRATMHGLKTKSYSIGNLSFINLFKLFSLYFFFKREKFDILVMNFSKDLKVAAPMSKLAKVPKIVYRRGSAIPIKNSVLNRFLFGKCLTAILANSEATKKTILQNNPNLFPAEKIKIIYNGIDTKLCISDNKKTNQIPVIGNLGRLVYQKGQDILIDIAEILKNRDVQCKFLIGGDGELMNELKQKTAEKKLENYIEFVGFVENPFEFMRQIDIFTLTSRGEGFGYVLAEAMLAKKPLLGFDCGSISELIFDSENGFLIPFENKELFADKLEELIKNPVKRQELGEKGFEIVQKKFDFEKSKQQVIKFLLNE